jgi:hypothetical protein
VREQGKREDSTAEMKSRRYLRFMLA